MIVLIGIGLLLLRMMGVLNSFKIIAKVGLFILEMFLSILSIVMFPLFVVFLFIVSR